MSPHRMMGSGSGGGGTNTGSSYQMSADVGDLASIGLAHDSQSMEGNCTEDSVSVRSDSGSESDSRRDDDSDRAAGVGVENTQAALRRQLR